MDDPALDESEHLLALRGLARLNRISQSALTLWAPIAKLAAQDPSRTIRLLDIASGSADVPLLVARKARSSGVNLEITASDFSSRATSFAQQQCAGEPAISLLQLNALTDEYPRDFDIVSNSLFLHHLDPENVALLLKKMSQAARSMVLISDLRRCRTGLMLAHVAGRLLTNSSVVHYDGPVSVRAAYTIPEVSQIAEEAGLRNVSVRPVWPCRYILEWHRK